MSKSGLMFDLYGAQKPRHFSQEITFFVGILRTAEKPDSVRAVDNVLGFIAGRVFDNFFFYPGVVASLLHLAHDFVERLVPGDRLPVIAARRAIQRLARPVVRFVGRDDGGTLAAKCALVHDVVRIAFEIDELAVLDVAQHAASAGAEVAGGGKNLRAGKFGGGMQCAARRIFGLGPLLREGQAPDSDGSNCGALQPIPAIHSALLASQ